MDLFHPELMAFFLFLVAFQLKHYVADFPLQTRYMLAKFDERGWVIPLASHCSVHAFLTGLLLVSTGFVPPWLILVLMTFDFTVHFIMDRVKASPKMLGRYDIKDRRFWWALGLDQMVHHLTHYAIVYIVIVYLLGEISK